MGPLAARASTMLHQLPEHLLLWLLTEWIDPEGDLQVAAEVLGQDEFRHLTAHPGCMIRATKILKKASVAWLVRRQVRVVLLQTTRAEDFGRQLWLQNGVRHRDGDLPAVVSILSGRQSWWQHGQLHRASDLPAEIDSCCQTWYWRGHIHRSCDRPARITRDGSQFWYRRGKRHRGGDKPAVVRANGEVEWWRNGTFVKRRLLLLE